MLQLEKYYNLSYTVVSLAFLAPFVGYTTAALINAMIHERFGQRGVAIIAPCFKLVAYTIVATHPPYGVCVFAFLLTGFGNGLEDSAWNAWVGPMKNCNEILGLLHGCYGECGLAEYNCCFGSPLLTHAGLGATLSPLIATTMVTKGHLQWYTFYYVMVVFIDFSLTALTSNIL